MSISGFWYPRGFLELIPCRYQGMKWEEGEETKRRGDKDTIYCTLYFLTEPSAPQEQDNISFIILFPYSLENCFAHRRHSIHICTALRWEQCHRDAWDFAKERKLYSIGIGQWHDNSKILYLTAEAESSYKSMKVINETY